MICDDVRSTLTLYVIQFHNSKQNKNWPTIYPFTASKQQQYKLGPDFVGRKKKRKEKHKFMVCFQT